MDTLAKHHCQSLCLVPHPSTRTMQTRHRFRDFFQNMPSMLHCLVGFWGIYTNLWDWSFFFSAIYSVHEELLAEMAQTLWYVLFLLCCWETRSYEVMEKVCRVHTCLVVCLCTRNMKRTTLCGLQNSAFINDWSVLSLGIKGPSCRRCRYSSMLSFALDIHFRK